MDHLKQEIEDQLNSLSDDPRVQKLLHFSLGRLAIKNARRQEPFQYLLSSAGAFHVRDWLTVAVQRNEPWLSHLDEYDRPRKLMKFSTLNQAIKEADKAMNKLNQQIENLTLNENDEELITKLENGYYFVRLLSPSALKMEGKIMQHCIGQGGYDKILETDENRVFSLRDPAGKPHATLLADFNSGLKKPKVIQLQGKQNKHPDDKYIPYLIDAFDSLGISIVRFYGFKNQIRDMQKIWYDHDNLPDGFTHDEDLVLPSSFKKLPKNMTINGDFDIRHQIDGLPDNMTVNGNLSVNLKEGSFSLPNGLTVTKTLTIIGDENGTTKISEENIGHNINILEGVSLLKIDAADLLKTIKLPSRLFLQNAITSSDSLTKFKGNYLRYAGLSASKLAMPAQTHYKNLTINIAGEMSLVSKIPEDLNISHSFYLRVKGIKREQIPARLTSEKETRLFGIDCKPDLSEWNIKEVLSLEHCDILRIPEKLELSKLSVINTKIHLQPKKIKIAYSATFSGLEVDTVPAMEFDENLSTKNEIRLLNTSIDKIDNDIIAGFNGIIVVENSEEKRNCPLLILPDDLGPNCVVWNDLATYSPSEYNAMAIKSRN